MSGQAPQTQNLQEQVQELVYKKLKENLQEWDIDKSGNSITVSYISPYPEDNADMTIWFNQNSIEIEYVYAQGDEVIDPSCASAEEYDICKQEYEDNEDMSLEEIEKICHEEAEKRYNRELERLKEYELVIERIDNEPIEHEMYIPASRIAVQISLPADISADKIADLITDIAMSLIHNV